MVDHFLPRQFGTTDLVEVPHAVDEFLAGCPLRLVECKVGIGISVDVRVTEDLVVDFLRSGRVVAFSGSGVVQDIPIGDCIENTARILEPDLFDGRHLSSPEEVNVVGNMGIRMTAANVDPKANVCGEVSILFVAWRGGASRSARLQVLAKAGFSTPTIVS